MKKPVRRMEFDILYGGKHRLAAHESSNGRIFWPLPGGEVLTSRIAAMTWAMDNGGINK